MAPGSEGLPMPEGQTAMTVGISETKQLVKAKFSHFHAFYSYFGRLRRYLEVK